tara:strand:+ start:768 stop:1064 length:297 start_codon:yes stop_codon:yes gene_type:complete
MMKRYNGKPRGTVNQGGATHHKDRKKFESMGKNYNSIDFELSDKVTLSNYKERSNPIGDLVVGGKRVELTWSECNKIITTLEDAKSTHHRKIQLGLFS